MRDSWRDKRCGSCNSCNDSHEAYGKAGIRKRSRKRNRNRNRNPNLRNKNWRRFCLESVTNNNCSIKTFHPHIIFIYCYYIFYCRIFCVRRKIFLREFHIRVSVATWEHDWHEYSSSLCRLSLTMDETRSPFKKRYSRNIKVFILFRFTEFEKMLPFYKNISFFVYRSRQSDESIEMWVYTCENVSCALNLCSSLRRNRTRSLCWKFLKTMITEDAILNVISTRVSGTGFSASQFTPVSI